MLAGLTMSHLAAIVESSDDAIISKNLEGIITSWNYGAQQLYGYTPEEMIGKPLLQLVPAERVEEERDILERVRLGHSVRNYQTIRLTKEGKRLDVSVTASPIKNELGQIIGISKVSRDISDQKRAEAALRESEFRYRNLVENIRQRLFIKDRSGRYVSVNRSYASDIGVTPEAMIGKLDADFFSQDLADKYLADDQRVMASGNPQEFEEKYVLNGREVWIHTVKTPIKDEQGRVMGICGIFDDISKRKVTEELLRRREERHRKLLVNLDAAVVVHAPDTSIIMNNSRALELLGLSEEQIMGRTAMDPRWKFIHEDHSPFLQAEYPVNRVIKQKAPIKDLCLGIVRPLKGDIIWVSVNGVPIYDEAGNLMEVIISFMDITATKLLLTKFKEATLQSEKASAAKSEFLGVMSHELRTPLNGILGFTEILLSEKNISYDDLADKLRIIKSSGESLLRILEDILHYSRIEGGNIKFQKIAFSLPEMAWKAIRLIESDAIAKSLNLLVVIDEKVPGTVMGDPERIQQVLLNLLRNAVKFTLQGSIILKITNSEAGHIRFAVKDTGVGIAADQIQNIFLPFTQVDSGMGRKFEGVGLGLAISQRLVEQMGSCLGVESKLAVGSTFTFEVLLPSGSSAKEANSNDQEKWKLDQGFSMQFPVRILAVEDNPINLKLLLMVLGRLGYKKVLTATNGVEALAVLEKEPVDLIFMDLQMPVMTGIEATHQIRAMEATTPSSSPVKIVALTANASVEIRNECFNSGMNHYISKPFNTRSIADAISQCRSGTFAHDDLSS